MAAIRSEGGLLPADVLARVAALDRELGGLAVSDFHLAPNERLGEAIARAWARLTAAWDAFSTDRDGLPAGDHAGRLTRERWLLPLFSELGYGRLVQQSGVVIDGKTYAVFCEYNRSPVHLVGAGVPLDRRTAGVRGAADQSPHSLVQELLNRSNDRLWGIVTNGLSLRLLRDNLTLTRQAYVEFDLEAIFATEAYEDFALLWLCGHQSRLEAETPEECWLEQWTRAAQRDGTRALGELRSGVERAIEALGRGFLAQPANSALHNALRDGTLDGTAYYRELLRLIYRLLFLFVAEDRDALLLPDDGTPERFDARERYNTYYSTKRLRRLSVRRRGGRAHDLYEQIKLLSGWLHDSGQPVLALPALGSALWSPDTTTHVSDARLGNEALLEAVRELSYVEGGRRPVDFRNLGAEELGSVYESLLELHPAIDRESASFALTTAAGHERKQTGSYYTPTSLIGSLLETALDPVIDEAAAKDDPQQALLGLTVCDPACGSGHFLIAAANRIAKRLAAVREHDPEPAPEAIRHALRDVVSRCVYGVDVNPMAVELCKVTLWLEALEPGRPLSFLEDRILLGNSLLGATPALVAAGIPDDALKPLLGDDRDVTKAWRTHNARERKGQRTMRLQAGDAARDAATLTAAADELRGIVDDSLEGVRRREHAYRTLVASAARDRLRLAADAWIAAFVTPKVTGAARITTGVLHRAEAEGAAGLSEDELAAVRAEAHRYAPLHWHVAFPAIFRAGDSGNTDHGWVGGFDCVLGNPPWEQTELKEKEFFAARAPAIAEAATGAQRKKLIEALSVEEPVLYRAFQAAKRLADGVSHIVRMSGRYPLCGRGRINTYAIFAECMRAMIAVNGRLGVIVPTGIATDDTTRLFFADIVEAGALISLYDFENRERVFPEIDSRMKFCLLTIGGASRPAGNAAEFAFFAHHVDDLNDPERRIALTVEDIQLFNPNTRTCPVFRNRRDAALTKAIYERVPVLVHEGKQNGNPWGLTFRQGLFNMTSDSHLFRTKEDLQADGWLLSGNVFMRGRDRYLPLYEAKMVDLFDHRRAGVIKSETAVVRQAQPEYLTDAEHSDPSNLPMPRSWVRDRDVDDRLGSQWGHAWLIGWRDVTSATNERTVIPGAFPRTAVGNNLPIGLFTDAGNASRIACLLADVSSFVHDFVARFKVGGTHLNFFITQQLPALPPETYDAMAPWDATETLEGWLRPRVLELVVTADDIAAFGNDLGYAGPPFRWDTDRRFLMRAELDAAYLQLYGMGRKDAEYILDSFPIVRRKDEDAYGEYRTKRVILGIYDAMTDAARGTLPYATRLDPRPADPRAAHRLSTVEA